MRRLPNVKEVVAQVLSKADALREAQQEKVAEQTLPSFNIPAAEGMYKLAEALRGVDSSRVTVADVKKFASQLRVQA